MNKSWNGFKAGDKVVMLIKTMGANCNDEDIRHDIGANAVIDAIDDFGPRQGKGVHVTIGEGDNAIVNSFDDRDVADSNLPFRAT